MSTSNNEAVLAKMKGQYPDSWDEYIGQDPAKAALRRAAKAATLLGEYLPHILITSPIPGIGKTALAMLLIRMAQRPVHFISGALTLEAAMDMFSEAQPGDVCFYDEFHTVMNGGPRKAEWMLNYLVDGVLLTPWGLEEVPAVTFIGATTNKSDILQTIVERFKVVELDPYTDEQAAQIAIQMSRKAFAKADMPPISERLALQVAAAGANRPRQMRHLLMSLRDLVVCEELDSSPSGDYDLGEALVIAGLSQDGLTKDASAYLRLLKAMPGGKAGKEVLKARLGLAGSGLHTVESLLFDKGLIVQTAGGRQLTVTGRNRATRLVRDDEAA